MTDLRTFADGEPRLPTAAETEYRNRLIERGLLDVNAEANQVPELWPLLMQATEWWIVPQKSADFWDAWKKEIIWAFGRNNYFHDSGFRIYEEVLTRGRYTISSRLETRPVTFAERLAAFEHALDIADEPTSDLWPRLNERLRHFRVPLRLEGNRFVSVTSEHLHEEIVVPTLRLLQDSRLEVVNDLYRKAWDRYMQGDHAGTITAVSSAVEETLRLGGARGSDLPKLTASAQQLGWIQSGPAQMIGKLHSFREQSDAHAPGTDDPDVSMLFLRIGSSLIHYLGSTLPQ